MDVCKEVANSGAAVVMVVHQPTSKAFAMMDHLIFLKGGRTMYQGRANKLVDYVAERGFPVPDSFNPAEWMVELSLDNDDATLEKAGFFDRGTFDLEEQQESTLRRSRGNFRRLSILDGLASDERTSIWSEYSLLTKREFQSVVRNKSVTMTRVQMVLFGAVAHAIAFWNIGESSFESEEAFTSHVNAVFFLSMSVMFVFFHVLIDITEMQPLFLREYTSSYFRLVSYALSTVTFEIMLAIVLMLVSLLILSNCDCCTPKCRL